MSFTSGAVVKNSPVNEGDSRDSCKNPWVRNISWRRKWQLTEVLLPGKFHGQRSRVGYSPWSCKESDMAENASTHYVSLIFIDFF